VNRPLTPVASHLPEPGGVSTHSAGLMNPTGAPPVKSSVNDSPRGQGFQGAPIWHYLITR